MEETIKRVFNHCGWKNMLIPLITNNNAAMIKSSPAKDRSVDSFIKEENNQDFPDHPISG